MNTFQEEINKWMLECFGPETTQDQKERAYRFFEEACELVQALDMPKLDAVLLLDYVYDRPAEEDIAQEVGGVMTTLAALCNTQDISIGEAAQNELFRCRKNTEKIRRKHAAKELRTPLPGKIDETEQ